MTPMKITGIKLAIKFASFGKLNTKVYDTNTLEEFFCEYWKCIVCVAKTFYQYSSFLFNEKVQKRLAFGCKFFADYYLCYTAFRYFTAIWKCKILY